MIQNQEILNKFLKGLDINLTSHVADLTKPLLFTKPNKSDCVESLIKSIEYVEPMEHVKQVNEISKKLKERLKKEFGELAIKEPIVACDLAKLRNMFEYQMSDYNDVAKKERCINSLVSEALATLDCFIEFMFDIKGTYKEFRKKLKTV